MKSLILNQENDITIQALEDAKIYSWKELVFSEPTILTIGNFDGVHQGHQLLLKILQEKAGEFNLKPVVLTFNPHPRIYFKKKMKQIDAISEKIERIKKCVDVEVVVVHFDFDFSELEPEKFVDDFLKKRLKTVMLIQGEEHFFGKNRQGSNTLLKERLVTNTIPNPIVKLQNVILKDSNNVVISSSNIRKLLENGNVEAAHHQLNRPFGFRGVVVQGVQMGCKLGFPTANLETVSNQLIPKRGVYGGKILIDGVSYNSVINIGIKPTFEENQETIEVHILDFNQKIYGKEVFLQLYFRIRGEVKFDSSQGLSWQIQQDVDYLKNKITEYPKLE